MDGARDDTTAQDRVAIVTGGSRGMGRQVTLALAHRGHAVVVFYARDQRAADAVVEEVLAAGGNALAVRGDVTDELDVERLFAETTAALGGVDVVVHAVGLRGMALVDRRAARALRVGGSIVNLPTSCGASRLSAADAASTDAVEAMTRALAVELRGRDITVNAVEPWPTRPGRHGDVVEAVVFLVSDEGHAVNGQMIRIDDQAR